MSSDWQFIGTLLLVVFFSPLIILGTLAVWSAIAHGLECLLGHPDAPPSCDIDPRCHPRFAWGQDGNGYIGALMVVKHG